MYLHLLFLVSVVLVANGVVSMAVNMDTNREALTESIAGMTALEISLVRIHH